MNLSSTIKSIQDIMRKDDGVDGDAQRLGQLTWMLFLKVFDQREEEWEDDNPKFKSPLPEPMRWRNWAAYVAGPDGKKAPQKAASEIISFVNNELFLTLKELDANASAQHKVIRSVFEDANNYMKSGTQLLAVIEKLEEAINFHDFKTRANLGDVYEQLLNDLRGAGNAGEFYTPRAITQFMVERVNPRLDKRERVLDPACGTGGFLTAAIDHFRNQITDKSKVEDRRATDGLIRGIEKKQLPHLLCTTNLVLHDVEVDGQVERKNTLATGWNDWKAHDRVECIVTNPPFGGYEDDSVAAGYHHPTKETADLFMQLVVKLLDENGRAAVVLPDGFLFGDGIKAEIKRRLMQQCKLHTIVRLPKGVFAPYTTIKTNLLFFTKGAAADDGTEHFHTDTIWYYEHPYPAGYKSYSKTKPVRFEEFKPEQDWWGSEAKDFADRVENEFAWQVDFKTKRERAEAEAQPHWTRAEQLGNEASALDTRIRDLRDSIKGVSDAKQRQPVEAEIDTLRTQTEALRLQTRDAQATGDRLYWPIYNLDLKNPNAPEEESHDPDVLLGKFKILLDQIEETENRLKSELAAALAHHFVGEDA
ncbi:N-6 DNA methylase [Variovorax sp. LjRoot84]|uniref:class I SAM-dependent DNA methyltransferase n=1 Tax=Variovorax sp. LjRoot84 TaxID=3342340 RepID=UPI003F516AA4